MVAASLLLAACGSAEQDWAQTQQKDTIQAYQQFIQQYPQSEHVSAAKQQIAEIKHQQKMQKIRAAWQRVQKQDTEEAYQRFLSNYPNSKYAAEARNQLKQINRHQAWLDARRVGTIESLQLFISKYPQSPQAQRARRKIAKMQAAKQAQQQKMKAREKQEEMAAKKEQQKNMAAKEEAQKEKMAAEPQGQYHVQLAAFTQKQNAQQAQANLEQKLADALDGAKIIVVPPANGGSVYRIRTTGMSQHDATMFCQAVGKTAAIASL